MRPIQLKMTAFGSYAEETTVPFSALKEGLYLITGDTGAGKTTIFDAVMFALYGTVSGTERKPEMMHCDLVPLSTDTEVTLEFIQDGRPYTVRRTIHFSKVRGAADQYGKPRFDAELREPGGAVTEGATRVSDRCAELLGLNADQFRKIVMLAQGEFKEFLKADSGKKNEILGKLFDNSAYIRFQTVLDGARERLRRARENSLRTVENQMAHVFLLPADASPEEYLPLHPRLVENLTALTEADEARRTRRTEALEKAQAEKSRLDVLLGSAESDNRLLDARDDARRQVEKRTGQGPAMERRERIRERAETAWRVVRPAEEAYLRGEQALAENRRTEESLAEELKEKRRALAAAKEAAEGDAAIQKQIEKLTGTLHELESQRGLYEEVARGEKALVRARTTRADAGKALAEAEQTREKLLSEQARAKKALTGLADADARAADAKADAEKAGQAFSDADDLHRKVIELRREETDLSREQALLQSRTRSAMDAESHHSRLYRAFIRGQAGILADTLRGELDRESRAECPVCHTRLTAADRDRLAFREDDVPTRDQVDRARAKWEKLEKARREQETRTTAGKSRLQTRKDALLERTAAFPGLVPDWETLSAGDILTEAVRRCAEEKAGADARLTAALQNQEAADRLRKRLNELEEALSRQEEHVGQAREDDRQAEIRLREEESALRERKSSLPFPTAGEAELHRKATEQARQEAQDILSRHEQALRQAGEAVSAVEGRRAMNTEARPGLEEERRAALARLGQALRDTGFADPEKAHLAIAAMGETAPEEWLRREQAELQTYRAELQNWTERLRQLEADTKGRARTDLAALEEQRSRAGEAVSAAQDEMAACLQEQKNHRAVLDRVREARQDLARSDAAMVRLDRLATLAMGEKGEGGRLSFDRYVMGSVFRDILRMANHRLEVMSGGRYALEHETAAGRANAAAGLGIQVMDYNTGRVRESASLSGGESFLVSLALALGLSDVVQNRAGGRRLDALFVDEGFGTLDDTALDSAITVLNQLTEGHRLVGIISHVNRLEECVPQQILVKSTPRGSTLSLK